MIVRRHFIPVLTIFLTFWAHPGSTKGERWSRQVLNSEWIPLADPRSLQHGAGSLDGVSSGVGNPAQVQQLALPPGLREQYQQQLLQLQQTQESIQKLLQLQQQLRAQQQLLQAQSYVPESFSTDEERKHALHQSTIVNLRTLPQLAPGALLPPPPGDQPQLPEFNAQNFLVGNPPKTLQNEQVPENKGTEQPESEQTQENNSGSTRHYKTAKQMRDDQSPQQFVSQTTQSSLDAQGEGEEEVQLLYVPAETLAQRDPGQKTQQRVRNRKQFSSQQQQPQQQPRQQNRQQQQQGENLGSQGLEGTRPSAAQQAFAHQVLYQLQQEQAERTRLQQEERDREIARLREEQEELDRRAKLHQELVEREQEKKRQKELELRKELERQEEAARQKELEKIRAEEVARKEEIQRQLALERQKIADIREQDRIRKEAEARQAEIDRLAALERQKEAEIQQALKQQQEIEKQQAEEEARARGQLQAHRQAHQETIEKQKQAQIDAAALDAQNRAQNQAQQQHLTETTRPTSLRQKAQRSRPRNRQEKKPAPNQPPLSVYMGINGPVTNPEDLRVSDVLNLLKNAKTISVLDSVGPDTPQVFVGPTSLDPPTGYAKFDLPYLSAVDNNRVERKVDKLPFFVAPLSFKPPPGYSKIPFPAPHIGSVVVNTLDNGPDSLDGPPGGLKTEEELRPLIEPNSYQGDQLPTRNPSAPQASPNYSQDGLVSSTTPSYENSYSSTPAPGTRYRHRQFYNDRSAHVASTPRYEEHSSTGPGLTRTKFRQFFKEEQGHGTSNYDSVPTVTPQSADEGGRFDQNVAGGVPPVAENGEQQTVRNTFQASSQDYVASQLQYPGGGSEQTIRPDFTPRQNADGPARASRVSPGPGQYTIPSELPRISPQLPGLVNSLIEEQELMAKTAPPTTTSTTTTTETPTTTYRSRGRQRGRIVPTRAPTTTENAPTRSSVTERPRRPFSRSRIRQGYATTTETYHETIHDTPKTTFSGTEEKDRISATPETQRRPAPRNQRYRGRVGDGNAVQQEARPELEHNPVDQEANYGNNPSGQTLQGPNAQLHNSNGPVYRQEVPLPSAAPSQSNEDSLRPNAQPLLGGVSEGVTLEPEVRGIQGVNYQANFGLSNVEQAPVNGFNYQSQNEKFQSVPEAGVQSLQGSPQYQTAGGFHLQRPQNPEQIYNFHGNQAPSTPGKENVDNFQNADLNRGQVYESHSLGNQNSLPDADGLAPEHRQTAAPVFDHPSGDRNHLIQGPAITTTEAPEATTPRPNLTPAPLTTRPRVRSRLNQSHQRTHVDAPIQTRPTGPRDEFVRFSAVNQDTVRHHSPRVQPGARHRQRNRLQGNNQANAVQTEGHDFVRVGSPPQRQTATTTTQAPQKENEEIEYGFIRPPSFKPIHPVGDRHAAVNVAPTYRPKYEQVQTEEPTNEAPVEVNTPQAQVLNNRQKYQVMNRRPLTRSTAASQLTTTSAQPPVQEEVNTVKPILRNDDVQGARNRGRVRRPGKRRTTTTSTTTTTTTTTTESILDSSNELPHEENYPQIIQGVPAPPSDVPRRTLFDEELKSPHLETLPQAEALQRPVKLQTFQHQDNLQFPGQDFVLNFGIGSEHEEAHDQDYDQTQIASSVLNQRKYNHINRGNPNPRPGSNPVTDIEGAESQWSTKLTHSSFQPSSLVNQVQGGGKNSDRQDKSEDSLDIITARPDLASVDVLVTSNNTHEPRDVVVNASYLGNAKKEGLELKETRRPVIEGRAIVERANDTFKDDKASLDNLQFWNNGQDKEATLNLDEPEREPQPNPEGENEFSATLKISDAPNPTTNIPLAGMETNADSETVEEPTTTKRTVQRRRRLRVRVRPAEDFVSAESQHAGSAWNSLVLEKQNYDKSRRSDDFKTTIVPSTSSTTEATSVKTFLEELLDEMSKDSDVGSTVPDTLTTTNAPDVVESTTNRFSRRPEEATEIPEATTTPGTTTTNSASAHPGTTTFLRQETSGNDKFVADVTTEKKSEPLESLEKAKLTESILQQHKFRPKHPHKLWWNHKHDAATKASTSKPGDADKTTTSAAATDPEESTSEAATTTIAQGKDSSSEPSLSDYMDAFFGTMPGHEEREEEKIEEAEETRSDDEKKTLIALKKVSEEQKSNVSGSAKPATVEEAKEVAEEVQKVTRIEDATTAKAVEEVGTTLGQEVTSSFVPQTTPEVPLSPEELTTEIPATTTTLKPNVTPNNQMAKVLRTSTTTEVSHMTEICYRGRCVKTKSRKEVKRK